MEELKACPFCGKKDTVDFTTCVETEDCVHFEECPEEEPYYCVVCNIHKGGCGASGGFAPTRQEAVENWNRRAEPENKPLTAEQLKCMNHKPVWATGKRSLGTEVNGWMLVNATSSRPAALDFAGACNFDSYGKTWIAYARKPEWSENNE